MLNIWKFIRSKSSRFFNLWWCLLFPLVLGFGFVVLQSSCPGFVVLLRVEIPLQIDDDSGFVLILLGSFSYLDKLIDLQ